MNPSGHEQSMADKSKAAAADVKAKVRGWGWRGLWVGGGGNADSPRPKGARGQRVARVRPPHVWGRPTL